MSDEIHFYAVRAIRSGQQEALADLSTRAGAYFRDNCPGTLEYEWYTDPDGTVCHLFERYSDSEACLRHLDIWGERFAAEAHKILDPLSMCVYGNPSQAVREKLLGANPVYCCPVPGGYRRF